MSTDLALFLPEPATKFERLLHYQLDKSASSNMIFLSFSGLPRNELAEFNRQMTKELRASKTFKRITNNAETLSDSGLKFLEKYRYLLSQNDLSQQFSVEGLSKALKNRLDGLASSNAQVEKRYLRNDPTGEVFSLLEEWQGKISKHRRPLEIEGVWFSDDQVRTLILVEIAADISKLVNQEIAVMEIRSLYAKMKLPGLTAIMTGPAIYAVESGEDIQQDVKWLTLIAVSLVTLFLLAAYRSIRFVFLIVSPLIAGVTVAIASILLLFGQIHGITLAFGITLAGVAVDYPIHLLTGLQSDGSKASDKVSKIWRTLKLGVLSTVVAYAAFLVSGFGGLQQLGLFTIIGLVTAALFSRWILPPLARYRLDAKPGLVSFHQFLKNWGQKASRLGWVVIAVLIASTGLLFSSQKPVLHLNIDSLSPITEQRRAQGKQLRNDIGFWHGGSMILVTGKDTESVLQYSERIQPTLDSLVNERVIDGYDMASHLIPSQKLQAMRKSTIIDITVLQGNLDSALSDLPFRNNVFDPFIKDIKTTRDMPPVIPSDLKNTAIGAKLNPLLFELDGEAVGVVLLHGVSDDAKIKDFANQHDDLYYMHLKTASTDLIARSIERVGISMTACILIIYLSLVIAFRNLLRPLKIMIPTFSAALVTAAILVITGNPLSIFHLISLLLVVGLGLDYALFFNRLAGNQDEWDSTFKSLWICAITTILVFGALVFSQTPPLEAIGKTVGSGALISIIFAAMWATRSDG